MWKGAIAVNTVGHVDAKRSDEGNLEFPELESFSNDVEPMSIASLFEKNRISHAVKFKSATWF
jgi:hypothetical protein